MADLVGELGSSISYVGEHAADRPHLALHGTREVSVSDLLQIFLNVSAVLLDLSRLALEVEDNLVPSINSVDPELLQAFKLPHRGIGHSFSYLSD